MKKKSKSDDTNNKESNLTESFFFSLYHGIPFLKQVPRLPPIDRQLLPPIDRQLLGSFSQFQLMNTLDFLTIAEIVNVNLATCVEKYGNTQRIYGLFQPHVDRNKPAIIKAKILQYIELGEEVKAQAFRVKHDELITKQSDAFKYELCRRIVVTRFLRLVAQGLKDEAEVILQQDRTLLMESGVAIDASGRRFDNVTAIQCSQWNLDAHMSTMLMKYVRKGNEGDAIRDALREQEKARLEKGLRYELCRAKIILTKPTEDEKISVIARKEYLFIREGNHIEIGYCDTNNQYQTKQIDTEDEKKNPKIIALLKSYDKPNNILNRVDLNEIKSLMSSFGIKPHQFCEHQCTEAFKSLNHAYAYSDVRLNACKTPKQWDELDAYWCKVIGLLQSELPAHALYELTRKDRPFHPTPKFDEDMEAANRTLLARELLARCNTIYICKSSEFEYFIPPSSGLGVDFVLVRGAGRRAMAVKGRRIGLPAMAHYALVDSAAFSALFDARCADIKAIDLALDVGQSPRLGL